MKKAIVLTAYNRLRYLQQTLESWYHVRGLEDWHFRVSIDPSEYTQHMVEEAEEFFFHRRLTNVDIVVNPLRYGVLLHPKYAIEDGFDDHDFVVRAEDDLMVSSDILEYFSWAAQTFNGRGGPATVQAWSDDMGPEDWATVTDRFNPLVWGTWKDRWEEIIEPEWDGDYSTNNGTPGVEAGWDWNLNRIFQRDRLAAIKPVASRVQNIGLVGTHSTPENYVQSPSFQRSREKQQYKLMLL